MGSNRQVSMDMLSSLRCPVCGTSQVQFHSRVSLSLGSNTESTEVFICYDSHTFLLPLRALSHAHANTPIYASVMGNGSELMARGDAARASLHNVITELRAARAQSRRLWVEARQSGAEMVQASRTCHALLAECYEGIEVGAGLSDPVLYRTKPSRRTYPRIIQ